MTENSTSQPKKERATQAKMIQRAAQLLDWREYWKTDKVPSADLVFNSPAEKWRRFLLFLSQVQTVDKDDGEVKPYPLDWDYLRRFAAILCNERMLIVDKVRQVLATITQKCLVLFEAMERANYFAVFTSRRDEEAKEFIAGIREIYDRLPKKWKEGRAHLRAPKHYFRVSNGAVIKAEPPSAATARSQTANRILADEAGEIPDCEGIYQAAKPTLGLRGHLAFIGTTHFAGTQFYRMIQDAEAGLSKFHLHKINVGDRPDRNEEWQKQMLAEMGEEKYASEFQHKPMSGGLVAFPVYSEATHVIDNMPDDFVSLSEAGGRNNATPVFMAIDPHTVKPTAALWVAQCPSGLYVIDELWLKISSEEGQIRRLAERIRNIERNWRIVSRVADPSSNTRHGLLEVQPVRAQLQDRNVVGNSILSFANANRSGKGLLEIVEALQISSNGQPRLKLLHRCTKTRFNLREYEEKEEDRSASTKRFHFVACLKYIMNEIQYYTEEPKAKPHRETYITILQQQFDHNLEGAIRGKRRRWIPRG